MRNLVLAIATLAILTLPATAQGTRADAERNGDLFVPYGDHPPTAQQRRADPDLARYRGLTPREPGIRLTPAQQDKQMRDNAQQQQ